jgi:mono/diheme cytochrome c family protein
MPTTRHVFALFAATVVAAAACKPGGPAKPQANGSGIHADDRIAAGGVLPAANALSAPRPANLNPDAGGSLFSAMNCDGCHGGGAVGWVGPSLVDGRWRYGGADEEIFTSIFYGRPKGMPAYGGVIGTDGVWTLVAYIKAQAVPTVVPTTSWLPGGNATATPTEAKPEGAAAPAGAALALPPGNHDVVGTTDGTA